MPMAAWRQWAVKVGVVCAIVLCLAAFCRHCSVLSSPSGNGSPRGWQNSGSVMLLLTVGSLYISSLCRSGVARWCCRFRASSRQSSLFRRSDTAAAGRGGPLFDQPFLDPLASSSPVDRRGRGLRGAAALARLPQSPNGGSECRSHCQAGAGHRRLRHDRTGRADSARSVIASNGASAAPRRRRSRGPRPAHPAGSARCATPRSARPAPACRWR